MNVRRRLVLVLVLGTWACERTPGPGNGTGDRRQATGDRRQATGETQGSGKTWPADTPAQQACQVDGDCSIVVSGPAGPDPCCDVTVTALPVANKYLQFAADFRKQHCAGVTCPPLPLPGALLADCGYQPRCNAGKCDNMCNAPADPTIGAPAVR